MLRYISLFLISISTYQLSQAQRLLTKDEAIQLGLNNQLNLKAANLSVQQQQQLVKGAAGLENPEIFVEASPYEPLVFGAQQTFSMPGAYRNRRALQNERIRLAQLQLQGSQYDLKREILIGYLQLQYLVEKIKLLQYQDSIYQAIKIAAKRFFDAGQINKLEELTATTQADAVRNEFLRAEADLVSEKQIFRFFTNYTDSFTVESIENYLLVPAGDTLVNNIQQQILQQQIAISEKELKVVRSELLPQITVGVMFPTTKEYERPVGYQLGLSVPIWRRQNRGRIAAAQTSMEIARAQQELELIRLNARYRQAFINYRRDVQSLVYYNTTAIPQARSIIQTSQRLFDGGQLSYIESLRNLQAAFEIYINHLDTHRVLNETLIELNYLKGTL